MMAYHQWKILLVEDDEDDYLLTREMLAESHGISYNLEWANTYRQGKERILQETYDAILMDYQLGPDTGLELTREVTQKGCKAPIILLTGRGNYQIDVEAMEAGATDYLAKSEATASSLERAIRYAILQKQNEEALRHSKEELETRVQERTAELSAKNAALEAQINERKRIETELAEVQRRLIDRTEAQQRELARDLHDGPMQELYGLIFQMDTLRFELKNGSTNDGLDSIKQKILEVIQSLRSVSRDLRPPALAPYGLEKTIRSHAEELQVNQPDLKIDMHLEPDGKLLPEEVRLALFRIYQNAITNVIRHAKASQVSIRLMIRNGQVIMEITDNGCGFDVPKRWIELARKGHMGLVGAAERAEAAGGKLDVISEPGKGTTIRVVVPGKQSDQQANV